ncbi:MAG: LytTR family DNA-binding domain-containing protein [Bacteroidales bacterium]
MRRSKLKTWLNRPFPFYETYRQKLIVPFLFGLFIMFFLFAFNPSHNTDFISEQFFKVFAYGFITFFTMSMFNMAFPLVLPKVFDSEKWNVQKTIVFLLLTILSIGMLNGLFGYQFDNPDNNSHFFLFLLSVLVRTITIGILPIIIFVFYFEKSLYKKHQLLALETIEKIKETKISKQENSEIVNITSPNTKVKVELVCNDLYCIKAEENYCTCFFNKDNHVEKTMIRISLKQIEQIFSKSDRIIRCHKSYIVNLDKVSDITGNARGYFFTIDELNFKIPGSRNLSKAVITEIR